jgi:uncharacterized protein (TIGR02246 family)
MTKLWTTALALALGAALTTSALAGPPRSHIETALANFTAAFNSGDGAGVAALYTHDAALLPPGGARVDGRDAIQAFWQGAIDGGLSDLTLNPIEVESNGNLAYEVSTFSFKAPGEGGEMVTASGKYIVVWKRSGSHNWQLYRDIWNMDPAP